MKTTELKANLRSSIADLETLESLPDGREDYKSLKKRISLKVSSALVSFSPCPDNAGCDGCKCGYDGNIPDKDGEIGGGGGGGM